MRHLAIPGGWYTHALPDGEYASLVADGIVTHDGKIPQPVNDAGAPDGPLFIDITTVGGFHIAGKGANSYITHERKPDGTWARHPDACGNYSVIYDLQGVLHISDCSIGSQGWRYVALDGTLVTGDQTTGHPVGLWEWTDLGGVLVGQGDHGVRVYADGMLRQMSVQDEHGHWHQVGDKTFDIKARRVGDRFSLSFYDVAPDGLAAHIFWGTMSELAAMPPVVVAPPPPPPPVDPPEKPPVPDPINFQDYKRIPEEVNRDYPGLIRSDEGGFVDQVAHRCNRKDLDLGRPPNRWGRKQKSSGSFNTDALTYLLDPNDRDKKKLIDVIKGDAREPWWDVRPANEEPGNGKWAPPQSRDRDGETRPNPLEPPDPFVALGAYVRGLEARIKALEDRPVSQPSAPVSIDGARIALQAENGHYLVAEDGGGGTVNANRPTVGGWETWTIRKQP